MMFMDDLPPPLTTVDDDISGLDGFILDTDRLMVSELWALATGDEFKAAIGLWCRAWKQIPAGSLPSDDRVLAAFSGAGKEWRKVKDMALRGFVLCSDGRLYHKTLCEDVKRAADSKRKRKERTKAAGKARHGVRNGERNGERNDDDEASVTSSHSRAGHVSIERLPSLNGGADGFDEFWEAYPKRSGNTDEAGARVAFEASESREQLTSAAKAYAAWCRENGKAGTQYVKQAKAWIVDGVWQEWQPRPASEVVPAGILVKRGMPSWDAWQDYYRRVLGKPGSPISEKLDGWYFPSILPPVAKPVSEAA